ncbi:hypothetical protein [Streptomyces fradiae]|uniref:hypothetical protein n=1 Tax=Streptomyces fradiae TaxID=1906 RepID=UPI0035BE2527
MTETVPRAPRPLSDTALFVLWWAWAWQSSGATARGTTLTDQLTHGTPWWWWVILAGLLCGAPMLARAPGAGVARTVRRFAGSAGAPAAVAATLAALVAPALVLGVGCGAVVSALPLAERWDSFLRVAVAPPALAVYAAGCAAVLLLRRRGDRGERAAARR